MLSAVGALIPWQDYESLDAVTTRALRHSHCSILAVREVHVDLEANEAEIARLADACRVTWRLIEDDRAVEALPFIQPAAQRAPFNATIQEAYAIVLEKVGQQVEASSPPRTLPDDSRPHRPELNAPQRLGAYQRCARRPPGHGPESGRPADGLHLFTLAGPTPFGYRM